MTPLPGSDPIENAERTYPASLDPAQRRASHSALVNESRQVTVKLSAGLVVGAATAGCIAQARQVLFGSVERFLRIVYLRNELPRGLAVADARVQQASGCNPAIDDADVAAGTPWILANEERILGPADQQTAALDAASAWVTL